MQNASTSTDDVAWAHRDAPSSGQHLDQATVRSGASDPSMQLVRPLDLVRILHQRDPPASGSTVTGMPLRTALPDSDSTTAGSVRSFIDTPGSTLAFRSRTPSRA